MVTVSGKAGVIYTTNLFCDEKGTISDKKAYVTPKISVSSGDMNSTVVTSTSLKLDAYRYAKMHGLDDLNIASRSKLEVFLPSNNLKSKFSYVQADTNKPGLNVKGQLVSLDTFDTYFTSEHELTDKLTLSTLAELEKIHLTKKYNNLYDSQTTYLETSLSHAFSDKIKLGPLVKTSYTKNKRPKKFSSQTIAITSKYDPSFRLELNGYIGLQFYNSDNNQTKNSFAFKGSIEYILSFPSKIIAEFKQKMASSLEGSLLQKTVAELKLFLLVYRMIAVGISGTAQYHNYNSYKRHDRVVKFGIDFRAYFGENRYIDMVSYQFIQNHSDVIGKSYVTHMVGVGITCDF
ncbi:MAG: hypothetical protein LBB20_03010 [Puniceicoccales bacterium]|jgi:hypothetical protein|nr:hypothetical protein [Puniceicoccales bacterium]